MINLVVIALLFWLDGYSTAHGWSWVREIGLAALLVAVWMTWKTGEIEY